MKILVTGGAGYLGSTLVDTLLRGIVDVDVTVVDNFMYRQTSLSHLCSRPYFKLIRADVRDMEFMRPLIEEADAIVMLAAIVGAPACDWDKVAALTTNYEAVRDTANIANPDTLLIYANTNSGYGKGKVGQCTEEATLSPVSWYGQVKVQAEDSLLQTHDNSVSFRFATLFGASARMRLDLMVNDFVYKAVHHGHIAVYEPHFRRNFLHVRDAARAIAYAIRIRKFPRGIYNVGDTSANMTKAGLLQKIKNFVPNFDYTLVEGSDPDQRDYIVSNAKIEETGWSPTLTIDEGIEELIRCYQQPFSAYRNV